MLALRQFLILSHPLVGVVAVVLNYLETLVVLAVAVEAPVLL
jgi:hypothetical protein